MNYRDVSSVTATSQPSAVSHQPRGNLHRLSDALTASIALALTVGAVCLLCELPARLVLLAALSPWGLLALARLLALATVLVEEFLALIGRPRDLNQDGQVGFSVKVDEGGGEPWR
jgi:hypothetical protein